MSTPVDGEVGRVSVAVRRGSLAREGAGADSASELDVVETTIWRAGALKCA